MKNFFRCCAALVCLLAPAAMAGPFHDPFMERFQVGRYAAAESVVLVDGYPGDLFLDLQPDSNWSRAALAVASDPEGTLTGRFLTAAGHGADLAAALAFLATESPPAGVTLLAHEARVAAFFAALRLGDDGSAYALAAVLAGDGPQAAPEARDRFVWELRRLALGQKMGQAGPAETAWPQMLGLGPFDAGGAWTLWVAHRRALQRPVLAVPAGDDAWRSFLSGLGDPQVTAAELYASDLPELWQAGLGAVLLPRKDLAGHFQRFPSPPDHLALQGLWVRGQRRLHSGDAKYYEELARRDDLRPAWRLDLWRRASELRLLDGDWSGGLASLQEALALSRAGRGNSALRGRLREWVEQAMVLALAQGRRETALRLHDMGLRGFTGDEKTAFLTETSHWDGALGIQGGRRAGDDDTYLAEIRERVTRGQAGPLAPVDAGRRQVFAAACDQRLWELWVKWGVALADLSPDTERASAYRRRLAALDLTGDPAMPALEAAAPEAPWDALVEQVLDRDIALRAADLTPPRSSAVPSLARGAAGDVIAVHALLGCALALGDMRGSLAAAYLLPQTGLTRLERRRFLYPLPGKGPIREALLQADSDPALLLAIARNESLFEPAIRSRAGALGWMQIMPFHYEERGALAGPGNWANPAVSIAHGDELVQQARRRYDGDPYRVLAAYNAGPGAADRWDRQLGGSAARDIYLAWIGYPETRRYVEKVLMDREIYSDVIAGEYPDR